MLFPFSQNPTTETPIISVKYTRANSFPTGTTSSALSSISTIPIYRQLPNPSNVQFPTSAIDAQIPTTPFSRPTTSASPPTTAGVDIFHSIHSPFHQSIPTTLPTFPGSDSNPTNNNASSKIRPSQLMTPDQIIRRYRTTTTPPHQAHLDTSHTSRITTTVSTRFKTLIPHRSSPQFTPQIPATAPEILIFNA